MCSLLELSNVGKVKRNIASEALPVIPCTREFYDKDISATGIDDLVPDLLSSMNSCS